MWWSKKEQKQEELSASIKVIPEEFYGTKDPVVHYKSAAMKGGEAVVAPKENAGQAAHGISKPAVPQWLKNKKVKIVLLIVFFVLIIAGISWYYVNQAMQARKLKTPITAVTTQEPVKEEEQTVPAEEVIPTSTAEIVAPTEEMATPTSTEPTLEFPDVQLLDSADLDSDSLTDIEEESFGTDPGKWDTDGDGYYDGQEVFNLYNPQGIAPMKIIDSGLVKEYVNPTWQYRLYYPAQWALGTVEAEANHVLFSALSGDFVEVVAEKMNAGEAFADWFARKAAGSASSPQGQIFSDLQEFTNRFQENCWKRSDDLVAYFVRDDNVFTLIYHPGGLDTIPYRHIMQMVVQSFRPVKTAVTIPEQPIIPEEGP